MKSQLIMTALVITASTSLASAAPRPGNTPPPPRHDGPPPAPVADARPDKRPGPPKMHMPKPEKVKVPFLGVATGPIDPPLRTQLKLPEGIGLIVQFVEKDSPAEKAGLKRFDVLHKLGNQLLVNHDQLRTLIHMRKPGDKITLTAISEGKSRQLEATLIEKEIMRMPHAPGPPRHGMQWQPQDGPQMLIMPQLDMNAEGPQREKMIENLRKKLGEAGVDEKHIDEMIENLRRQPPFGDHMKRHFERHRWQHNQQRGDAGPDGDRPRQGHEGQSIVIGANGATSHMSMSYSDDEHSLNVTVDEDGKRLVAKTKDGDVVYDGPIDTPEQRGKVPAEVRRKLNRLEDTTRIEIRVGGDKHGPRFKRFHQRPAEPKPSDKKEKPIDL